MKRRRVAAVLIVGAILPAACSDGSAAPDSTAPSGSVGVPSISATSTTTASTAAPTTSPEPPATSTTAVLPAGTVAIVFDDPSRASGMTLHHGGDVDTAVVTVGDPAVAARRTGNGASLSSTDGNDVGDFYLQIDIDDEVVFEGYPTTRVRIEVEYLDVGTDAFVLQYDATTGGVDGEGRFRDTEGVFKTDTGEFRVAVFEIDDAWFANRDNGADLRVSDAGEGAETIRSITIVLLDPAAVTSTTADAAPGDVASIVFHNGPVVTMNGEGRIAEGLAVAGDRIVAVGDTDEVLALVGEDTVVVDLDGRALLPGLVDAHAHWIGDRWLFEIGGADEAASFAAEHGWTTISELFVDEQRLTELVAIDEAGLLPVRVNAYLPVNYHGDKYGIWFEAYEPGQVLSPHVRVAGAKAFIDPASPDAMWLSADYANRPGYRGDVAWTQPEIEGIVADLHDRGWQIAIHTCGDAAHDMVLDAFAAALDGEPNTLRHRIEHVAVVRDDQIERMADLGIVASIQPTWFHSDWPSDEFWGSYEAVLGPGRIGWAGRWRDLLDGGLRVIGGTDTPWTPASSFGALAEAVTGVGGGGAAPPEWMLEQRIEVDEALHLVTGAGAWGTGEEDVKGMLAPGMYADLVIVSRNPLTTPPERLATIDVLATIVGGETVSCGRRAFCP